MSVFTGLINDEASVLEYLGALVDKKYVRPCIDVFLVGSRGKGTNRNDSDWDVYFMCTMPVTGFREIGRYEGYNIDFSAGTKHPKSNYRKLLKNEEGVYFWSKIIK